MKSTSNVAFLCPKEVLANVTDQALLYNTKANVVKMNKDFKKILTKFREFFFGSQETFIKPFFGGKTAFTHTFTFQPAYLITPR